MAGRSCVRPTIHRSEQEGTTAPPCPSPPSCAILDAMATKKKAAKRRKKCARTDNRERPKDRASKNLTPKQAAFCREYLVDLNATQAAIRAGYAPKAARRQASDLLTKPDIQTTVSKMMEERADRVELTADRVLRELMAIGFADPGDLFNETAALRNMTEIPEELRRAIVSFDASETMLGEGDRAELARVSKIRLSNKLGALELLGRHLRLFPPANEHSGPNGGPIQTENPPDPAEIEKARKVAEETQVRLLKEQMAKQ